MGVSQQCKRSWWQGGWWCTGALLRYKCWEGGCPKPTQVISPSTFLYICYSSNGINWLSLLSDLKQLYFFYPLWENDFLFLSLSSGGSSTPQSLNISLCFLFCTLQSSIDLKILLQHTVPWAPCQLFLARSIFTSFCNSFLFILCGLPTHPYFPYVLSSSYTFYDLFASAE